MEGAASPTPTNVRLRTVLLGSLIIAGVVLVGFVAFRARMAVAAIVAAALIATALLHGVDALTKRHVRRPWANAIVLSAFLLGLAGLAVVIVPVAANQASELVERGPELLRKIREAPLARRLEVRFHVGERLQRESQKGSLSDVAPSALAALGSAVVVLVRVLTVLFLTVFMVLFGRDVVHAIIDATGTARHRYERVLASIYASVGGYLAGLTLVCSINAVLTTTFLAISGTPYFLPLGLASGFSSLVPFAGPFVAGTLVTLIALASGGLWHGLATLIYFLLYDSLEGNVLAPLIFRRTVHMNPLVSLVAVVVFGEFAGVVGALIAVPAAAAVQLVAREYLSARNGRATA